MRSSKATWPSAAVGSEVAEEAHDAEVVLPPAGQGAVDDLLEHQEQALAGVAEGVEGARLDERLHRPLVEHRGVDPVAEVVEVGERPARLALGDDQADEALPDVADGRQAEGDLALVEGGEVRGRRVDVGHQDVDAHGAALGQVDGRLVLVVLDAGEQGGQVLDGVVGLQPGRLVGDQAVAEGVRLAEGVVGERLDDVEQLCCPVGAVAVAPRSRRRTSPAPWP